MCFCCDGNTIYAFSLAIFIQIDKFSLDSLQDGAELHLQSLEPWIQVPIYVTCCWVNVLLYSYCS